MKNMYNFEHIAFHDIAVSGNTAWFCNIGYNALFQLDVSTGQLKLLSFFPNDTYSTKQVYSPISYFNNKLYIAPRNGKLLLIYDLINYSFSEIELDLEKFGDAKASNLFNHIAVVNEKIYLFPGRFHAIVEFDPISHLVSYFDDWYEELSKNFRDEERDKMIFHEIHLDSDGNCLLPCWKSQDIVKMNICSREYEIMKNLSEPGVSLSDAIEINDNILYSSKNEKGIWNTHKKLVLSKEKLQFTYNGGLFLNQYKEWIYAVPWRGDAIVRYNTITFASEIIYWFPQEISKKNNWIPYKNNTFCQKKITENELAIYSSFDGKLIFVKMNTGQTKIIDLKLDEHSKEEIINHLYELMAGHLIWETEQFDLKVLLSFISNK